ncbi:MAG: transcription antitermination protein NusB, partial [Saprospiraceae bacterium]
MLSRRNIRIKILQVLFSQSLDPEVADKDVMERYRSSVQLSYELYLFNLYLLVQVANQASKDAARRKAKYVSVQEDKLFSAKLLDNPCTDSLVNNNGLKAVFKFYGFEQKVDEDFAAKLYKGFAQDVDYVNYVLLPSENEQHIEMLLKLYKHMIKDEYCTEVLDDHFNTWEDDESLVVGVMKKTIKSLPVGPHFYDEYKPEPEATIEFGEGMLRWILDNKQNLLEIIKPTLENWDADRVAIIDMNLIKMAVCEFLTCPSIPTKATLNEYVEISKQYSTDKSKEFINGVL